MTLLPLVCVMLITRSPEPGSVGLVPAVYSAMLFIPSPSGSHVAQDWLFVVCPLGSTVGKYCARHESRIPSPTWSRIRPMDTGVARVVKWAATSSVRFILVDDES